MVDGQVNEVRREAVESPGVAVSSPGSRNVDDLWDAWDSLRRRADELLRSPEPSPAWGQQLRELAQSQRELTGRHPDLALYFLVYAAGQELHRYSALHGMACATIAELSASWLGWSESDIVALVHAALTMNVSMTRTQDELAAQVGTPTERQRAEIEGHAEASARFLEECGIDDPLWLHVVRQHHVVGEGEVDGLPVQARMSELLRRIDVYTAKLSRRRSRGATTPAIAARDACLGPAGHPDSIGATMLSVLGLYPPGTWVSLSNGELGIVIARGAKAHTPVVAALRRADGGLLMQPARRSTDQRAISVTRGITGREVRVRVNHVRTLTC